MHTDSERKREKEEKAKERCLNAVEPLMVESRKRIIIQTTRHNPNDATNSWW